MQENQKEEQPPSAVAVGEAAYLGKVDLERQDLASRGGKMAGHIDSNPMKNWGEIRSPERGRGVKKRERKEKHPPQNLTKGPRKGN